MGQRERELGEAGRIDPVGRENSSAGLPADPASPPSPRAQLNVRRLKLSPATNHALERFGHTRIDQIMDLSDAELLQNPHLTPQSVAEIRNALRQFASQPDTSTAAPTTQSHQTPTDESASRPVFPFTGHGQNTDAPTANLLSGPPPSRTSQPAPPLSSDKPNTARELGLSYLTTRALERFGQWRVTELERLSDEELSQNPYLTASGVAEVRQALQRLAKPSPLPDTTEVTARVQKTPEPASGPTSILVPPCTSPDIEVSASGPDIPRADRDRRAAVSAPSPLSATSPGRASQHTRRPPSRKLYIVYELGLSDATTRALERFGQWRVRDLERLSDEELRRNPFLTASGVAEIRQALQRLVDPSPSDDALMEVSDQSPETREEASDSRPASASPRAGHRPKKSLQETRVTGYPPTQSVSVEAYPTALADDPLPVPVGELGFSEQTTLALYEHGIFTLGNLVSSANPEVPSLGDLNSTAAEEVQSALSSLCHIAATVIAGLDTNTHVIGTRGHNVSTNTPLKRLGLSQRCHNALVWSGFTYVEQLLHMGEDELLALRGLGRRSLAELRLALDCYLGDSYGMAHARVIDTSICVLRAENLRGFQPTHCLNTQVQAQELLMLLESGRSWESVEAVDSGLRSRRLPSLIPPSTETILGPETIGFLLRLGCPLTEISANRLTVSKSARDYLQRTELSTVLRVFLANRAQLQQALAAKVFEALVFDVDRYAQWLAAQSDWSDEIYRRRPSPTAFFHLAHENWEGVLGNWLGTLDERDRKAINLRYGIDGGSAHTMQEIADELVLTRSRVHQIEANTLRRLRGRLTQHEVLGAFVWLCHETIKSARICSAPVLLKELSEYLPPDACLNRGQVRLLIEVSSGGAQYLENQDLFEYGPARPEIDTVLAEIRSFLMATGAPIRFSTIVDLIRGSRADNQADIELIRACLQAHPGFVNVEDDFWGLESWERHIGDNLVMILRRLGRPAHFSELTQELNVRLSADSRKSERNVLAHLQRITTLFVRTGPGTFGLRENHPDLPIRPIKYVELIEQVLQEAGRPLQVDEVFQLVSERREAKRASVQIYLSMDPRFVKLGPAQYGLSTWRAAAQPSESTQITDAGQAHADDFTDALTQRVRQWLEHSS